MFKLLVYIGLLVLSWVVMILIGGAITTVLRIETSVVMNAILGVLFTALVLIGYTLASGEEVFTEDSDRD